MEEVQLKKLRILGTGCPRCKKLAENVKHAVDELNIEVNIEKITEIRDIMEFGLIMTPALVIDGEIRSSGKVPSIEEIKNLLIVKEDI